jgi:hypothetical protein
MVDTMLLTSTAIAIIVWGVFSLVLSWASNRDMFKLFSVALVALFFNSFALVAIVESVFFPTFFGSGTIVSAIITFAGAIFFLFVQFAGSFILTDMIAGIRYSEQVHRAQKQKRHPSPKRRLPRFSRSNLSSFAFGRWEFKGIGGDSEDTDQSE